MPSLLRLLPLLAAFVAQRAAAQPRAGGADSLLLTAAGLEGRLTGGHIGQQASVVYFAARLLGRDARLYDGSWAFLRYSRQFPCES